MPCPGGQDAEDLASCLGPGWVVPSLPPAEEKRVAFASLCHTPPPVSALLPECHHGGQAGLLRSPRHELRGLRPLLCQHHPLLTTRISQAGSLSSMSWDRTWRPREQGRPSPAGTGQGPARGSLCLLSAIQRAGLGSHGAPSRLFYFFVFFGFCYLGPHLWHMEVPRLGVGIGATAASPYHSHSHAGSKLHL